MTTVQHIKHTVGQHHGALRTQGSHALDRVLARRKLGEESGGRQCGVSHGGAILGVAMTRIILWKVDI
jgi:hypothetical protein